MNVDEICELNKKLARLRHEVNNNLSLIIAAAEIIRRQPERAEKFWNGLTEKPHTIAESVSHFRLNWKRRCKSVLAEFLIRFWLLRQKKFCQISPQWNELKRNDRGGAQGDAASFEPLVQNIRRASLRPRAATPAATAKSKTSPRKSGSRRSTS